MATEIHLVSVAPLIGTLIPRKLEADGISISRVYSRKDASFQCTLSSLSGTIRLDDGSMQRPNLVPLTSIRTGDSERETH